MKRRIRRPALLLAVVIALAGCGGTQESPSAGPQRPQGASVAGTPVTGEVAFARETMEESRAFEALAAPGNGAPRLVRFLKAQVAARAVDRGTAAAAASWSQAFTAFPGPSSPNAPTLSASFVGLTDTGTRIPPDTMGAAGRIQLLETLNTEVAVLDKVGGTQLSRVGLDTFWPSTHRGGSISFDPRSLYDHNSGRFVTIALAGSTSSTTRLLIGISATDNALGGWNKFGIPASSDGVTWADFGCPGVDDNNVYVTANMFNDSDIFQFSKIWVFPKAQLISGSLTSWTEIVNPPGADFTLRPAETIGASPAEYVIHEGYAIGSPPTRRFVKVGSVTFPSGTATWTDLGYVEVANYPDGIPGAPQPGTAKLVDTNDTRLLNAVFRDGALWTTHTVANAAGNKTEVAWYKINPASANPSMSLAGKPLQQGRVSDSLRFYYYPSIAVNALGDAALGFSGSSATEYPGAYYTGRQAGAADNTMQGVGLLKAGTNVYTKDFGSGSIRWGDYSATCVDPADNTTFWTIQEYAASPDNTWATWWGKFTATPETVPNAPYGLTAVAVSGTQVNLSWSDNSINETGFIVQRSLTSGSGFSTIGTALQNATSFQDTGASPSTQYFYRVLATNGAGNSAPSNEATATTPTLPNAPTGLTATAVSPTQINLAWTDASADETGFKIERKTGAAGTWGQIGTAAANATTFNDGFLTAGTTYFYRVRATNTAGDSAPSNEASATTPAPASGGGGGGCSMASGRPADPGSSLGGLLMLLAPLFILAGRAKRRG